MGRCEVAFVKVRVDVGHTHGEHFFFAVTEVNGREPIHVEEAAVVSIDPVNRDAGAVHRELRVLQAAVGTQQLAGAFPHQRFQMAPMLFEFQLTYAAIGDVARQHEEALVAGQQAVPRLLGRHRQLEPVSLAIDLQFDDAAVVAAVDARRGQRLKHRLRSRRRQHVAHVLVEQGFARLYEQVGTAGLDVVVAAFAVHLEEQVGDRFECRREIGTCDFGGALRCSQLGERGVEGARTRVDAHAQREIPRKQQAAECRQHEQATADVTHVRRKVDRWLQPFLSQCTVFVGGDQRHAVLHLPEQRQLAFPHRTVRLAEIEFERLVEIVLRVLAVEVEVGRLLVHAEELDFLREGGFDQSFVVRIGAKRGDALLLQDVDAGVAVLDADLEAAQRLDVADATDRGVVVDQHREIGVGL